MAATESSKATGDAPAAAPWYAAYPAPKSEVVTISREEVLAMLKSTPVEKRDFALVDLRRNDFEVSFQELVVAPLCTSNSAPIAEPELSPKHNCSRPSST